MKNKTLFCSSMFVFGLLLAGCSPAQPAEEADPHTYGDWIEEVAATCKETGTVGHYHCEHCGKDFDVNHDEIADLTLSKVDHTYGDWVTEVPSTCKEHGTAGHYHCSVCDKNFNADHVEITDLTLELSDHAYGDWIPEDPGTCNSYGTIGHYHCSVCDKNFDADHEELSSIAKTEYGPHGGKHYAAVAPKAVVPGHEEVWVCDSCGEVYLEAPQTGTWTEGDQEDLVFTDEDSYYVPTLVEQAKSNCVVTTYTGYSFFEQSGTYEFNIEAGTKDLFTNNTTVQSAYETLVTDSASHAENEELALADIATFQQVVVDEYAKEMAAEITAMLTAIYGSVRNSSGILSTALQGGYWINAGGDGPTWVCTDPTSVAWGSQDNRSWIPTPYVAYNIITYANSLAATSGTFASIDAVSAKFALLVGDVARACGQFIADVEAAYAMEKNGKLVVGGADSSIWWFEYAYAGTSGLYYAGGLSDYDPSTCSNYRLAAFCNEASYSSDLGTLISSINWLLKMQIDDMFQNCVIPQ